MSEDKQHLIIGISGASGFIYGVRLLELLQATPITTHLIISKAAERTRLEESDYSAEQVRALADVNYAHSDIGAAIASGSFQTLGMIVAPCSMKTLAEIALGMGSNLISRAADVVLKERRRLVLMTRETPLHAIHLENMLKITKVGGIIAPPVPAFYTKPETIDDIVAHSAGRVLDLFGLHLDVIKRWQ